MKKMFEQLSDWLDNRTGYREQLHEALYENIPGGSKWRYVTGSMLVFAFATQMVTGIFLWMAYSPSSQTAWESVFYIQNEMTLGWFLRGVHHFMAQAMVVLLPIHMLQVIVDKAYKAPREINYWLGLVLMLIVMALGLTGYLLPWDQKGYWATKVATNLMGLAPFGAEQQKLVVGGSDYGHHTLTRFFALHAGILPLLLIGFLALHVAMFRRHGITPHNPDKGQDQFFWPFQVLKDGVACLVLMVLVILAVWFIGAEMSAPAEPSEEYAAARPEWYFLFLFQLLKKFGEHEFIGAIVVPGLIVAYLFAMPLIVKWKFGHLLNLVVFASLFVIAGFLTVEAWYHDNYAKYNPDTPIATKDSTEAEIARYERFKASRQYLQSAALAHHEYERMKERIEFFGISKEGAATLARNDPEVQGPRLFVRHCASCHSYISPDDEMIIHGPDPLEDGEPNGAPNLYGFASREWLAGFFDPKKIATSDFFGNTAHAEGEMADVVMNLMKEDGDGYSAEQVANMVAALSAEAKLPYQSEADAKDSDDIEAGLEIIQEKCIECHSFRDEEVDDAVPNLTDYGSSDWLRRFIADPTHFYGGESNDRMPSFAEHEDKTKNRLSDEEIDILVRWIRQDEKDLHRMLEAHRKPSSGGGE